MDIADNVKEILGRAENAARRAGRDFSEITVLAASKMNDAARVRQAFDAGIRHFGENRVQELTAKYDPAYRWHFIGQLQTNKVKYIADKVELIHSLDRTELAKEIDRQAAKHGKIQDCLVEVNMGSEISKGGVAPEEAAEFLRTLQDFPHIRVRGLMSVLPNLGDTPELRSLYAELQSLFESTAGLSLSNYRADILSAGMSGDYKIALEYGSQTVRLGRTLLGERIYPASAV